MPDGASKLVQKGMWMLLKFSKANQKAFCLKADRNFLLEAHKINPQKHNP
jgi:hypothetical protein